MPAVPSLVDEYVKMCENIFVGMGIQYTHEQSVQLKRVMQSELTKAYKTSPRSVVVIEFPDGMHEYVTTPVKRVLRLAGREVFYIETINSRYRLEVRSREDAVAESAG